MSEQTKTEIIDEEYQHFRLCGIPHSMTVKLLAAAYEVSTKSVRDHLRRAGRTGVTA